jgi:adenosylcobinamide-GDP ribazoletransferase
MAGLPNTRAGGLSAQHGAPSWAAAGAGVGFGLLLAMLAAGSTALWLALAVALVAAALAGVARAKIGGQTGDVLGATQVLAEVAALAVATAYLA